MLLLSACVLPKLAFKITFPTGFPRVRCNLARQRQWADYTFAFGLGRLFAASAAEELKPCAEFKSINMNDGAKLAAKPAFKRNGAPWLPRGGSRRRGSCCLPRLHGRCPQTAPTLQKDSLQQNKKGHSLHFNEHIKRRSGIILFLHKKILRSQATAIKISGFCNWVKISPAQAGLTGFREMGYSEAAWKWDVSSQQNCNSILHNAFRHTI